MRKKKKVNANETYMQTVMRRFRAHHLAKISLVILVVKDRRSHRRPREASSFRLSAR